MTLQRFASKLLVSGTLLAAFIPAAALAREHGGDYRGERGSPAVRSPGGYGGQRYSGAGPNYAPPRSYGGHAYIAPRGYAAGPSYYGRGYAAPRYYGRPYYRGYYSGRVYLGYGAPYGYSYAPGYDYDPEPAPPYCAEGAYDQYGNWVPSPNCYSSQPQYQTPPPQEYYDPRYNR